MVWEAATGRPVLAFGHGPSSGSSDVPKPLRALAFTSGQTFASASEDGTVKTWRVEGDWSSWRTLEPIADRALALDFDPFGSLLAVGAGEPSRSGEVTVWETGKGLLIHRLDRLHSDSVCGVAFSPDGSRLATASADRFLKVVDVSNGAELRSFEGHNHHVLAVAWSPDGQQIATGGADGALKLWDDQTGESVRSSPPLTRPITSIRWSRGSSNPRIAGACGDRKVRLWNPSNLGTDLTLAGADAYLDAVALSADRSRVAAGGDDGVLFLWDGQSGRLIRTLEP